MKWLSKKLGMKRPGELSVCMSNWISNSFEERRGRKGLSVAVKQEIYNKWLEHSIISVDCRNRRESVTIKKCTYQQKFGFDLMNEKYTLREKKK